MLRPVLERDGLARVSFHPNDIARRARAASFIAAGVVLLPRSRVLPHAGAPARALRAAVGGEPAARGAAARAARDHLRPQRQDHRRERDRLLGVDAQRRPEDSLRASLQRLTRDDLPHATTRSSVAVRRYRARPTRPTVILPDASFDVVWVLEEHRIEFPAPDHPVRRRSASTRTARGRVVRRLHGRDHRRRARRSPQYAGLQGRAADREGRTREAVRDASCAGEKGSRFVEVDARGRVVREAGARADLDPVGAPPLYTNIDLDLQRFVAGIFGDSLQGGAVAIDPKTGGVLALYSAPSSTRTGSSAAFPSTYYDAAAHRPASAAATTRRSRGAIRPARRGSWRPRSSGSRTAS